MGQIMRSKQTIIFIACIVVALGTINIVKSRIHGQDRNKTMSDKGVAVVELFTSEGCSSCPPADVLLSKLKDENNNNVFLLAFHVDYWNYLGWKDRFSDAAYSKRQEKYSILFNCTTYTPQMVINGSTQFVGSDESAARKAINESIGEPTLISISLQSNYNSSDNSVSVNYTVQGERKNELLNVALIQKTAQSNVLKGENSGRNLSHVNVVRDFQTISLTNAGGTLKLILPSDVSADDAQIVAYTQLASNLKVTGATVAPLNLN
jgi:hypothetical protein